MQAVLLTQARTFANTTVKPFGPAEAVAAGRSVYDYIPELRVSPGPFDAANQLFQRHGANVGSEKVVKSLLRLICVFLNINSLHKG